MNFSELIQRFRSVRSSSQSVTDLNGDYSDWQSAVNASSGYNSTSILERTTEAVRQVVQGEAIYERDSVIFDSIEYSWPLLAGLLLGASLGHSLNVIDFGGSLGSTFLQNRRFLGRIPDVRWNVIEQEAHVSAGKKLFVNQPVHFYTSIAECTAETSPTVAIAAGSLHYVARPFVVIDDLTHSSSIEVLIIDRTPIWRGARDMICVQTVPKRIYDASYPSWIFSRDKFTAHLERDWEVIERFTALDRLTGPVDLSYEGLILVRRDKSQ